MTMSAILDMGVSPNSKGSDLYATPTCPPKMGMIECGFQKLLSRNTNYQDGGSGGTCMRVTGPCTPWYTDMHFYKFYFLSDYLNARPNFPNIFHFH